MNRIKSIWNVQGTKNRKYLIVLGICLVIAFVYFYNSSSTNATINTFTEGKVAKSTIVTNVSGTGQVTGLNKLDIKSKVSGDVLSVNVKAGDYVTAGTVLVNLNSKDAQKTLRDANISYQSALISYQKLTANPEPLTVAQAEDSLRQANQSKIDTENSLSKGYEDGYNQVSEAFLQLPTSLSNLHDILLSNTIDKGQENSLWYLGKTNPRNTDRDKATLARDEFIQKYNLAKTSLDKSFTNYRAVSRGSSTSSIESMINETYTSANLVSDALKAGKTFLDLVDESITNNNFTPEAIVGTNQTALSSEISKTNSTLSSLVSTRNSLTNLKNNLVNAQNSIVQKQLSLDNIKAGTDALDVKSASISLQSALNRLNDAKEDFANYTVRAPFDGVLGSLSVKKYDTVSGATVLASLISKDKIANLTMNESDISKISVGQKVSIEFDAIEDLTAVGKVVEIDGIGTVTQGVVNYNVKISIDSDDARIKENMSVTANILTNIKSDVLILPLSAVKTSGTRKYVETINANDIENNVNGEITLKANATTTKVMVETGLENDTEIEILSGLNENDEVIVKTNKKSGAAVTNSTTASNSLLPTGGNRTRAF